MVKATRTPQRFRPLCILEAASVEKTEIETLDFTQVGKRKTRPNNNVRLQLSSVEYPPYSATHWFFCGSYVEIDLFAIFEVLEDANIKSLSNLIIYTWFETFL